MKGQVIKAPEHRAALLASKTGTRDGKRRNRLRAEVLQGEELMRPWLADGRNVGSLAARTTKLLDLYGARVLAAAVEELLKKGNHDHGALAVLCEQSRAGLRPVLPIELGPHIIDRDVIPHDLGGYDDDGE